MFRISGIPTYAGAPLSREGLVWSDEALAGPDKLVQAARKLAQEYEGKIVGPPDGPVTSSNHLSSGISAVMLLSELFIPSTIVLSGQVPRREPLPPGAVG